VHNYTYDEAQADFFPWDNAEEKTGLSKALAIINEDLSEKLRDIVMHSSI
jgi:hypothetical protein